MSFENNSKALAREPFLVTVRELVRTYQSFSSYSEAFVREHGLTPSQFDVIATLGNTNGLSMGDIGEKTLITKGTLTGVVDRLEKKGWVMREIPPDNRRSVIVRLTTDGEALFERVFPAQLTDMKQRLSGLEPSELDLLRVLLRRLRQAF